MPANLPTRVYLNDRYRVIADLPTFTLGAIIGDPVNYNDDEYAAVKAEADKRGYVHVSYFDLMGL